MISIVNSKDGQSKIAKQLRDLRLSQGLTQAGLAQRSGVSLPTLKKFEATSKISLESFLKLCLSLGCLEKVVEATNPPEEHFSSIEDVLKSEPKKKRPQRGWRT